MPITSVARRALDESELRHHFERIGKTLPPEAIKAEDTDKDGKLQWEEFGGPKGRSKDEL